jgi:hypothetical protein
MTTTLLAFDALELAAGFVVVVERAVVVVERALVVVEGAVVVVEGPAVVAARLVDVAPADSVGAAPLRSLVEMAMTPLVPRPLAGKSSMGVRLP